MRLQSPSHQALHLTYADGPQNHSILLPYPPPHPDADARLINDIFSCIVHSMHQAVKLLETVGYASNLGTYNHKWNKPCFHDITRIGTAIDRLGNMIQGSLYENGYTTSIFDYQNQCGVTLLADITPESLSSSMNWTTELARFHLGVTASTQRIAPFFRRAKVWRH